MKRWVCFVAAVLAIAFATPVMAQDDSSKVEAFVGYSFVHFADQGFTSSLNGGTGQITYNLNKAVGVVADFGGYTGGNNFDGHIISYMFGPRLSYHMGRLTSFGQVLLGGSDASGGGSSSNAFSMAVGGGLDYALTSHFSVRPVQAEYYLTKFYDGGSNSQNNIRYSAGIVYRF